MLFRTEHLIVISFAAKIVALDTWVIQVEVKIACNEVPKITCFPLYRRYQNNFKGYETTVCYSYQKNFYKTIDAGFFF